MKGKAAVSGWASLLLLTNTSLRAQEIKGERVACSMGERRGTGPVSVPRAFGNLDLVFEDCV